MVDSGGANIASVRFALERLGVHSELTTDPAVIRAADRVILPGVGSAAEGMKRLQARGLVDCVRHLTQPVLGVCLGLQLLFEASEEGPTPTLGLIPGRVALLPGSPGIQVPHMGWNTVDADRRTGLLDGIGPEARFYFVHSFAAPVNEFTLARCAHGTAFAAIVQRANFSGVQFHPERSGPAGARLLRNFVEGRT
ncbi:MAG TPA: imidazole glycerol phosphate synthase subunit HisH [Lacunisphaera sp.]|jgi:glutamine amidotransferase|nr:imidazole glycerol phosphate synthase subunit HisH [Lacunisphaera sp.]